MELSKNKKFLFLSHVAVTLISFYLLVSEYWSGLGLFLFGGVQLIFSLLLCQNKKWALLLSGACFLLCFASFFRASSFPILNFFLFVILLAAQTALSQDGSKGFSLVSLLTYAIKPFIFFYLPFMWVGRALKGRWSNLARFIITASVTLFCLLIVLLLLSSADAVFSKSVSDIFTGFPEIYSPFNLFRLYLSLFVALYIFGTFFASSHKKDLAEKPKRKSVFSRNFSPVFLLVALLTIYAFFCAIQIKYLFLGASLPDGMSYSEYARRGFFELLVISGINLAVVLISFSVTRITKPKNKLTLTLCFALLAVTVFLLFCSFLKMYLYYLSDGLTRLRTLVFIFLIFEFIGLLFTFFYIAKPKFNIIFTYFLLMLVFWLTVNIANIDRIVAKNQVDMYLSGERQDICYVTTLSSDAAPEIERLLDDKEAAPLALQYFKDIRINLTDSWQGMNLADMKAMDIAKKNGIALP